MFAWQATGASLCFLIAGQLQGIVKLNNPGYVIERWHKNADNVGHRLMYVSPAYLDDQTASIA